MRLLAIAGVVVALNLAMAIGLGWHPFRESPEQGPDKLALVDLLRRGDFGALEQELRAYQRGYETGGLPESVPWSAFSAFEHGDPDLERQLDAWVEAYPDSYAAALARAVYHKHVGWLFRGEGSIRETSPVSLGNMRMHHRRAFAEFGRALALNPRLPMAYGKLIQLLRANGGGAAVRKVMEAGLAAAPASWNIMSSYLWSLQPRWGGSYSAIRNYMAEVREIVPPGTYLGYLTMFDEYALAQDLARADRCQEAVEALTRILAETGESARIRNERGHTYYWCVDDDEKALADFERANRLVPDDPRMISDVARAHGQLGNKREALAAWGQALALDPFNPRYLRGRGWYLMYLDRHTEAVEDYRKATIYGGGDPELYFEFSQVYVDMYGLRRGDEALAAIREAIALAPRKKEYWDQYRHYLSLYGSGCRGLRVIGEFLAFCERYGACASTERDKWQRRMAFNQERHQCPG